jgi:hypothetical protein
MNCQFCGAPSANIVNAITLDDNTIITLGKLVTSCDNCVDIMVDLLDDTVKLSVAMEKGGATSGQ